MRKSYVFVAVAMTAVLSLAACQERDAATPAANQANAAEPANAAANAANAAATVAAATGETVEFQGCPMRAGTGAGCITVKSGGVTYELYSSGPLPDPNAHVVITGTGKTGNASTCMAGIPLSDVTWHPTKMLCPSDEGGDKDK